MRWFGTRASVQPCLADSHHLDETAHGPWGAIAPSGEMGRRTERRVVPSGPPRAGGVPLRRDEAPPAPSRPCLARINPNLQGVNLPDPLYVVQPLNAQTQYCWKCGGVYHLDPTVVHGKKGRRDFCRGTPPLRAHSTELINYYFLTGYICPMTDCGQKRPIENPRRPRLK